ncbi:hypothetical protein EPD60_08735 [Flaviaesturariibacter flavus]|uniref:DUF4843 domain-containing protein n=1 Tax=Flaviaesturariibacter flavus TaxID=2502780 RepID=A0A4R1BAY5_9BACT|nr:hypothetical protein [Flaviaesturariibacter flavus]TCJ14088.1 hypothetical protein EPD60_08735 [Flaviaesturariibacter flavus]
MKKTQVGLLALAITVGLFSCIKKETVTFQDSLVEFDAAVLNTNNAYTPGKDATLGRLANPLDSIAFPILTRQPAIGRAVTGSDANITRTSGSVRLRVNLVGATRKSPTEVTYTTMSKSDYTLIGVPSNTNGQATAGTHYGTLNGKFTIPADSSWGYLDVPITDPGVSSTTAQEVVFRLTGGTDVRPNRNYSIVGIRIAQN